MQKRAQTFQYANKSFTVEIPLDDRLAERYRREPHTFSYQGVLPSDWRGQYYKMFLEHSADEPYLDHLLSQLQQAHPGAQGDTFAELVIAYVQGAIQYDWNTFHNIDQSEIRYPYQTLYDGTGVCADKSILLAKLLRKLGYDIVFFTFERANHMALGIRVPAGMGSYNSSYAFVESTSPTPVGTIPASYAGGIRLDSMPRIVRLRGNGNGSFRKISDNKQQERELTRKFGKDYLAMSPAKRSIKEQMIALDKEIQELKKETRGCRGTLPPDKYRRCQQLQDQLTRKVNSYNSLVARINAPEGR